MAGDARHTLGRMTLGTGSDTKTAGRRRRPPTSGLKRSAAWMRTARITWPIRKLVRTASYALPAAVILGLSILWPVSPRRSDGLFVISRAGVRTSVATRRGGVTFSRSNTPLDDGLDETVIESGPSVRFGDVGWLRSPATGRQIEDVQDGLIHGYADVLVWQPTWSGPAYRWARFGWQAKSATGVAPMPWTCDLDVPFWCPAAMAVLAPMLVWNRRHRRPRAASGRCGRCGYDLRATPGRCPEFGMAAVE